MFPAAVSLLLIFMTWRHALWIMSAVGIGRSGFPLLFAIGVLDTAVRMGLLMFLPFLLKAKGASLSVNRTVALAVVCRRRRRQIHLRMARRSCRGDPYDHSGGERDGRMHSRGVVFSPGGYSAFAAGAGIDVEWHLIGALRDRSQGSHKTRS